MALKICKSQILQSTCLPWEPSIYGQDGSNALVVQQADNDPNSGFSDPYLICPTGTTQMMASVQGIPQCSVNLSTGQRVFACVPTSETPENTKNYMTSVYTNILSNGSYGVTCPKDATSSKRIDAMCKFQTDPQTSAYSGSPWLN